MNYKELEALHKKNFTKGGNPEFHELSHQISALAYSITGKRIEACLNIVVTKGTIVEAAAKLGFEYDGNFSLAAYCGAHEYLGNYILSSQN